MISRHSFQTDSADSVIFKQCTRVHSKKRALRPGLRSGRSVMHDFFTRRVQSFRTGSAETKSPDSTPDAGAGPWTKRKSLIPMSLAKVSGSRIFKSTGQHNERTTLKNQNRGANANNPQVIHMAPGFAFDRCGCPAESARRVGGWWKDLASTFDSNDWDGEVQAARLRISCRLGSACFPVTPAPWFHAFLVFHSERYFA